jgi:hypothetical protein
MLAKTVYPQAPATQHGSSKETNSQLTDQIPTYNGRPISYPSSVPLVNIPTPLFLQSCGPLQTSPPSYALTRQQFGSQDLGQGIFNNLIDPTSRITSFTDNERRRDVFFKLKDALTKALEEECWSEKFDKDYFISKSRECSIMCCLRSVTYTGPGPDVVRRRKEQKEVHPFASRMAVGMIYQFQDQIPLLIPESRDVLIKSLKNLVMSYTILGDYFLSSEIGDTERIRVFDILMSSNNHISSLDTPTLPFKLKTYNGYAIRASYLFSLGTRTIYGGKYEPQKFIYKMYFDEMKSNNFPSYRWGTSRVESYQRYTTKRRDCIKLECVQSESGGTSNEEVFWQEAEALAQQYMSPQEFASLYT